jgi:hypothetical protein
MAMIKTAAAFVVIVLSVVQSVRAQPTSQPSLVDFKSPEHGFELLYLSNWKPQDPGKPYIVLRLQPEDTAGKPGSPVGLVMIPPVKPSSEGEAPTFDQLEAAVVDEAVKGNAPDAKPVVSTAVKLGGENARRVIMTGTDKRDGTPMKAVVLVAVHKAKGYAIAMAAPADEFDRRRVNFDRLIETFKFTQ